jgi:hypothetical protein
MALLPPFWRNVSGPSEEVLDLANAAVQAYTWANLGGELGLVVPGPQAGKADPLAELTVEEAAAARARALEEGDDEPAQS